MRLLARLEYEQYDFECHEDYGDNDDNRGDGDGDELFQLSKPWRVILGLVPYSRFSCPYSVARHGLICGVIDTYHLLHAKSVDLPPR